MKNFIATLRTLLMSDEKIEKICTTSSYDELLDLHDDKIINIKCEKFIAIMSKYY